MNSLLPTTGTNALLEQLCPFVPDGFLPERWPHTATGGRPGHLSAAQWWPVHLLAPLTPVHSVNLLLKLLPEQRAWRQFSHLPNRHRIPDVRMLHEFRGRVRVAGLRCINEDLLAPLLEGLDPSVPTIALINATDLPAACRGFKKVDRHLLHRARRAGRAYAQDRSEPLLRRLQETYAAIVALVAYGTRAVGAVEQWFGAVEEDALCPCCWQQSDCFSLRLTWCWGLLADAVCLLRARTLRTLRPSNHPLVELLPEQLTMEWDEAV